MLHNTHLIFCSGFLLFIAPLRFTGGMVPKAFKKPWNAITAERDVDVLFQAGKICAFAL